MSTVSVGPTLVTSAPWLRPLAWLSLLGGGVANLLFLIGDPYWLSLPAAAAAMALGYTAIRRGGDRQYAAAHIGVNLGILTLLLWAVIDLVLGLMMGIEVSLIG